MPPDAQRWTDIHDHISRKMRIRHNSPLPLSAPRGRREQIAEIFHDLGFRVGVEIGTWLGESAKVLCQKIPGVSLTCVDPWLAYRYHDQAATEQVYNSAVQALQPYDVTILRTTSMQAVSQFADDSLDFVSIDGDHAFDFVCSDLITWCPKVKRNGMVEVHDYDPHVPGVVWAVNAYTHCHCISPWYVTRERNHPVTAFWVKP